MSDFLSDLDRIDDRHKYTVSGFIRNVQNSFGANAGAFYIIPELVSMIILSFYYVFDKFDSALCGKCLRILNGGTTVHTAEMTSEMDCSAKYSTVYGTLVIDSMINATLNNILKEETFALS